MELFFFVLLRIVGWLFFCFDRDGGECREEKGRVLGYSEKECDSGYIRAFYIGVLRKVCVLFLNLRGVR